MAYRSAARLSCFQLVVATLVILIVVWLKASSHILEWDTVQFPVASRISNDWLSVDDQNATTGDGWPVTALPRRVWQSYPGRMWRGLQLPVLSVMPDGRLGNLMGEYATLYALGRAYNVTVLLSPHMAQKLNMVFPNISMPPIPGEFNKHEWKTVLKTSLNNYVMAEIAAAGLLGEGPFMLQEYPFETQLFHHYRSQLVREFTFAPNIVQQVKAFLATTLQQRQHNTSQPVPVLVGVHVRRTDYSQHLKKLYRAELPGISYLTRALQYYRDKFQHVLFIVASDDRKYMTTVFSGDSDVVLSPGSPRELDMAVLAACDHNVMTLGSFGFWSSYLAGGEVVYPYIKFSQRYNFDFKKYTLAGLKNFTPLPVN